VVDEIGAFARHRLPSSVLSKDRLSLRGSDLPSLALDLLSVFIIDAHDLVVCRAINFQKFVKFGVNGFFCCPYRCRIILLTRLRAMLLDGHAKRIEARFIVARSQLQVFGPYSQHRGLKLYEWFGRVEPDRGAGGDTALLLAGDTANLQACVSHVVSLPFWFFGLLPAAQPKRPQAEPVSKEGH
jgi:hypothetical protein